MGGWRRIIACLRLSFHGDWKKARISFTEYFLVFLCPGVLIEKAKMVVLPQHVNDIIYGTNYKAEEAKETGFIHDIAENRKN